MKQVDKLLIEAENLVLVEIEKKSTQGGFKRDGMIVITSK